MARNCDELAGEAEDAGVSDEKPPQRDDIEISPINPNAHRRPGGVWNEDELPVLAWEVAEQRKVLPPSVQRWVGTAVPVVRVSRDILQKQHEKHADILVWFQTFELEAWEYARVVVDERGRKWEFVQFVNDDTEEPWPLMTVVGEDATGSINVVSVHRRNRRWMRKLLAGRLGFGARER